MDLESKSAHAGVCVSAYGDNPAVNDIISWSLSWQKLDIPFGRPLRVCDTGSTELIPGITAERKQLALADAQTYRKWKSVRLLLMETASRLNGVIWQHTEKNIYTIYNPNEATEILV